MWEKFGRRRIGNPKGIKVLKGVTPTIIKKLKKEKPKFDSFLIK